MAGGCGTSELRFENHICGNNITNTVATTAYTYYYASTALYPTVFLELI